MNHDTQTIQQEGRTVQDAGEDRSGEAESGKGPLFFTAKEAARFWSKVNKNGPIIRPEIGPCWVWIGAKDRHGYGRFHFRKMKLSAHRLSLRTNGAFTDGPCALHRCDNPACVRPSHIFSGTHHSNSVDMYVKGRHPGIPVRRGELNRSSKATNQKVLEIRAAHKNGHATQAQLSREHQLSINTIHRIVKRHSWKHI